MRSIGYALLVGIVLLAAGCTADEPPATAPAVPTGAPPGSTPATPATPAAAGVAAAPTSTPPPVPTAPAAPPPIPTSTPVATAPLSGETWTVVYVVDGDTVEARSSNGVTERIRVIGIDTPERGECGFEEAADTLAGLVGGEVVTLVAGARDDRDIYGRLLRYIEVGSVDAGLTLIREGLAIARYDSRDGYGRHLREDTYVAADAGSPDLCD